MENKGTMQKTPIWQFKGFQNWVKSILISEMVDEKDIVAEFYCSGVDTGKWERSKIHCYYGFDPSSEALHNAEKALKQKKYPYPAKFLKCNFNEDQIETIIKNDPNPIIGINSNEGDNNIDNNINGNNINFDGNIIFDVVSCFDGVQNSFSNAQDAEQFIRNVSILLKDGGFFFGIIPDSSSIWYKSQKVSSGFPGVKSTHYNIEFNSEISNFFGCKYKFNLKDNPPINIEENLIHFPSFINICKKYNLTLVEAINFTDFYDENKKTYEKLLKSTGILPQGVKKIDQSQLELIGLYTTFIFVKEKPEIKMIPYI